MSSPACPGTVVTQSPAGDFHSRCDPRWRTSTHPRAASRRSTSRALMANRAWAYSHRCQAGCSSASPGLSLEHGRGAVSPIVVGGLAALRLPRDSPPMTCRTRERSGGRRARLLGVRGRRRWRATSTRSGREEPDEALEEGDVGSPTRPLVGAQPLRAARARCRSRRTRRPCRHRSRRTRRSAAPGARSTRARPAGPSAPRGSSP